MTVRSVVARNEGMAGTCLSLLIQELVETESIESTFSFLEVQPDEVSEILKADECSSESLWVRAAPNYALLRAGATGTDGELIRSLTLDRYLEKRLSRLPPETRALDVGCGGGEWVAWLSKRGIRACGIDVTPDPEGLLGYIDLRECTLKQATDEFPGENFSLVLLNLVSQWLPDLEEAAVRIHDLLEAGGRLILTLVTPEFSRNGDWERHGSEWWWTIKRPVRRPPSLTMVNRSVGPVRFFPWTTPDHIKAFAHAGLVCVDAGFLFLDSMVDDAELGRVLAARPDLARHEMLPVFTYLEFEKRPGC